MELINFIKNYSLFGIIPPEVIDQFFSKLKRQKFPPRQIILNSYAQNDHLYMLLSGNVRVVSCDERDVAVDLDQLKAGDCFGEMYLLSEDRQPFYIESITETEVLLIDKEILLKLLEQFPVLYRTFYQILLRRLHQISSMKEKEIKEELEVVSSDVIVTSRILHQKEEILNFLDEINLLLDSKRSFSKVLEKLTEKISSFFNLPLCAIYLEVWGKDSYWLQACNDDKIKNSLVAQFNKSHPLINELTSKTNAPLPATNTASSSAFFSQTALIGNLYCYPILDKGQLSAFILLGDDKPLSNLKEITETLDFASGYLAAKIYQVQLARESRWRKIELITLHQISQKLLSSTNLEELLFELVKVTAEVNKAKGCVLRLMDKSEKHLKIVAYWGVGKEIVESTTQRVGSGAAGWVTENKKSLIINDISKDERFEDNIHTIAKSLLIVPLINQNQVIGTITIFDKDSEEQAGSHEFNDEDLALLETLATQATIAIINTRLKLEADSSIAMKQEIFQDKVGLMGSSRKISHFNRKLFEAAQNDDPVLIHGEGGAGKLYAAQCIHNLSQRRDNVFVQFDCVNLLPENFGDEIFGFFNALSQEKHPGALEKAEGGTLVLKNIEAMPLPSQTKLAYLLKTKKFHKVGAHSERSADVKVVASTSAQLDELVKVNKFDAKLYKILTQQLLMIPSLRVRKKDITAYVESILKTINQHIHKDVTTVSPQALGLLLNYDWPGNVQELLNVLERGVMLSKTEQVEAENIFFGLPAVEGKKHFNLLRIEWISRLFKSKLYPAIFSVPPLLTLFVIMFFAYASPERSQTNPAVILSWYIGWPLLFLSILFLGRIWCTICPFIVVSRATQKLFSFNLAVPDFIKNHGHWIMTVFCLLVVWFEEVTDIYSSPLLTGHLILFIFAGALLFSLIFSRSVWCRYICPWGAYIGVFSQASLIALRSNRNICMTQCKSYDCYSGTDEIPGCPMFCHPYTLDSNRNCILCSNCYKNCPNQSILLNVRALPFELWHKSRPLISISLLCTVLAAVLLLKFSFNSHILPIFLNVFPELGFSDATWYSICFVFVILVSYLLLIGNDYLLKTGLKLPHNYFLRHLGYAFLPLALTGYVVLFFKLFVQKAGWLLPAIKFYWYDLPLPPEVAPLISENLINQIGNLLITFEIFVSLYAANEIMNRAAKENIIPLWKKALPFTLIILTGIGYLIFI